MIPIGFGTADHFGWEELISLMIGKRWAIAMPMCCCMQ